MDITNPFKWRYFQAEMILLCVPWYLRYPLSYRDLDVEELDGKKEHIAFRLPAELRA